MTEISRRNENKTMKRRENADVRSSAVQFGDDYMISFSPNAPKNRTEMGAGCSTAAKGSASAPTKSNLNGVSGPGESLRPLEPASKDAKDVSNFPGYREVETATANELSHAPVTKPNSLKVIE